MNDNDLTLAKLAASAFGKLGGSKKSPRKTMSSRLNAKKPRPNRKKKTNEKNTTI